MQLRILRSEWQPFVDAMCSRTDVESAGVILAERLRGSAMLARHLVTVPDDGYLIRRRDQLRIDPVVFNRLTRPARDLGLSVFTIHTHPGTDRPWFSSADDAGDGRLIPSLFAQMPGPHGSIVVAGASQVPTARAWTEAGEPRAIGVRLVGPSLCVIPARRAAEEEGWFDRQQLALGSTGQEVLRDLHVGVVGAGGTGSVVVAQLAHLGVGRVSVVDGDRVEPSNVSRILGATRHDAGATSKVDVSERYVTTLGLGTQLQAFRGHLGREVPATDLESCDVILSCVDQHSPRALLNRLAYRAAIPVIDLGTAFRVGVDGTITGGAGRVVIVGPGRACLACWGHLNPDRLRQEGLTREERASLAREGYVIGADVPEPSVVAFNTMVAGAGVIELLRLVTAFAGSDDPPSRLALDFVTGAVRRNRLMPGAECRICGTTCWPHPVLPLPRSIATAESAPS